MPIIGRKPIGTIGVMAGVPAVLTEFCWSFAQLVGYSAHYVCETGECIHLDKASFSFHSWARNSLVERMLGDWLFFLDTDHEFEPDLLGRLLHRMNEHNLSVVTGIYHFKAKPHPPVLYGWHENELVPLSGWKGDLIEVGASGAGNLLVKRSVFDRIWDELHEKPFDVIGQGGEDFGFYHRLRKLGIKAWCDTRVECKHLLAKPIGKADFDPSKLPGEKLKLKGKLMIQE